MINTTLTNRNTLYSKCGCAFTAVVDEEDGTFIRMLKQPCLSCTLLFDDSQIVRLWDANQQHSPWWDGADTPSTVSDYFSEEDEDDTD